MEYLTRQTQDELFQESKLNLNSYTSKSNKQDAYTRLTSFLSIHYLHLFCCFFYFKSIEKCNPHKYDCDFYYDKFTIFNKMVYIFISGAINGFILFFSLIKFFERKKLIFETIALSSFYLLSNYFFTQSYSLGLRFDFFDYSFGLFLIGLLLTLTVFLTTYFFVKLPFLVMKHYMYFKRIILMNIIFNLVNFFGRNSVQTGL